MSRKKRPADRLKLRHVEVDTYHENVAYLNSECEVYRAEGFQALSKIEVSSDGRSVLAVLNVVHDSNIVAPGELGLADQAFQQLGAAVGKPVRVNHAEPPRSVDAVLDQASVRFKDFQESEEEEAELWRGKLHAFRNLYAFLSQVIPCQDSDLERLYTYLKHLALTLPRTRTGARETQLVEDFCKRALGRHGLFHG